MPCSILIIMILATLPFPKGATVGPKCPLVNNIITSKKESGVTFAEHNNAAQKHPLDFNDPMTCPSTNLRANC